jgi:hypothetical protein
MSFRSRRRLSFGDDATGGLNRTFSIRDSSFFSLARARVSSSRSRQARSASRE